MQWVSRRAHREAREEGKGPGTDGRVRCRMRELTEGQRRWRNQARRGLQVYSVASRALWGQGLPAPAWLGKMACRQKHHTRSPVTGRQGAVGLWWSSLNLWIQPFWKMSPNSSNLQAMSRFLTCKPRWLAFDLRITRPSIHLAFSSAHLLMSFSGRVCVCLMCVVSFAGLKKIILKTF